MNETCRCYLYETADFFAGMFSCVPDDLPDGAYFQMHLDMAKDAIGDNQPKPAPEGIEEEDVVNYYFQRYHDDHK